LTDQRFKNRFYATSKKWVVNEDNLAWLLKFFIRIKVHREGNGYETWQSSLLYVFVNFLGGWPAQNLAKYKRWLCVLIQLTNRSIAIV